MTDTNPPADRAADRIAEIRARVDAYRRTEGRLVGRVPIPEFVIAEVELTHRAPADLAFLLARVEELEGQLAKGEEEWAIRVFTRTDQSHWFHQHADAETFEEDLAVTLSVAANSIDPVTGVAPVNHGVAVVKRTVWSTEWETVKTVEATGEPTRAPDSAMDPFEAADEMYRRWE